MAFMIKTEDDFSAYVNLIEGQKAYRRPYAFGVGIAHLSEDGTVLDTFYPYPNFQSNFDSAAIIADNVGHMCGNSTYTLGSTEISEILRCFYPFLNDGQYYGNIDALLNFRNAIDIININEDSKSKVDVVVSFIDFPEFDTGPKTTSDAYLRLHLLSHRLVTSNSIKLNGLFDYLPTVAWTNEGPISLTDLPRRRLEAISSRKSLQVIRVDKFPRMLDYVTPPGVVIGEGARVCLGTYLCEGTVVMSDAYRNFYAEQLAMQK